MEGGGSSSDLNKSGDGGKKRKLGAWECGGGGRGGRYVVMMRNEDVINGEAGVLSNGNGLVPAESTWVFR